jgi:hypothetical protein
VPHTEVDLVFQLKNWNNFKAIVIS